MKFSPGPFLGWRQSVSMREGTQKGFWVSRLLTTVTVKWKQIWTPSHPAQRSPHLKALPLLLHPISPKTPKPAWIDQQHCFATKQTHIGNDEQISRQKKTSNRILSEAQLILLSTSTAKAQYQFSTFPHKNIIVIWWHQKRSLQESKQMRLRSLFGCSQTLLLYVPIWHNPSLWRKARQGDKTKDYKATTSNIHHWEFTSHPSKYWNNEPPTPNHTQNQWPTWLWLKNSKAPEYMSSLASACFPCDIYLKMITTANLFVSKRCQFYQAALVSAISVCPLWHLGGCVQGAPYSTSGAWALPLG